MAIEFVLKRIIIKVLSIMQQLKILCILLHKVEVSNEKKQNISSSFIPPLPFERLYGGKLFVFCPMILRHICLTLKEYNSIARLLSKYLKLFLYFHILIASEDFSFSLFLPNSSQFNLLIVIELILTPFHHFLPAFA